MYKDIKIGLVFLLSCLIASTPTIIQARLAKTDFENNFLQTGCWNKITKEEMQLLLKDANPYMLKRLAEDAELKKQQIKNIRELLAIACQAVKEGLTDDEKIRFELENTRIELTSVNYDREKNKDLMPPFGYITEEQVREFYAVADNQKAFESFFKIKIELAQRSGQITKDFVPSEDEIKQSKDYFAKTRIYYEVAKGKAGGLPKEFWDKVEISVKLQQASYLSRIYVDKVLKDKTKVTDAEVQSYIAKHPEFDTRAKKEKAYKILQRIEAGENFAALAKEFSDDPGSKDKGGLYENIGKGQFMPEFEQAALSLTPGQIYPNIVETTYGFHIIKLINKVETKDENGEIKLKYDVRHILISTGVEDPNNPMRGQLPIKEFVTGKLEEEKQKAALAKILENNPIEIAEDFEIPKISDEEIEKSQQLQKEMPGDETGEGVAVSVQRNVAKDEEKILPSKIEAYLNSKYSGWKLSPSQKGCGIETNSGVVKGNFNADKMLDYAVKFTRGKKGYIIAFVARNQNYKAFVLHDTDAEDVELMSLRMWEKGEIFKSDDKKLRLVYDAPADYRCESDVGGIHYYQNGKFVAY